MPRALLLLVAVALTALRASAQSEMAAPVPDPVVDFAHQLNGVWEAAVRLPLAAVLDWARPQSLPVTVVPGVEHFFHGQLPLLKNLVARHLRTQE